MRKLILILLFTLPIHGMAGTRSVRLQRNGSATQLLVGGEPFLVLGGELGNSSAANTDELARIFPKLQRMGLNTVLVPVYWELTEPEEGRFDFSLTDRVIEEARRNRLRVVFLWFGAWKNSMSCYAPLWFKRDVGRFPRARTRSGKPLEIASAFSEEVFRADSTSFVTWLDHVLTADAGGETVLMVQIENEVGMLEEARDHAPEAEAAFAAEVPSELVDWMRCNRRTLHPHLRERWEGQGVPTRGNWQELFGEGIYTDEIFMAWHYARYVGRLAACARSRCDLPLYVNAALNSRGRRPGEYPSAGPLAHLIDVWHCAAPEIDLLAPDIYDTGFRDWVAQYHRPDNPLFIPEMRRCAANGAQALYLFGEHDAIGVSPFSIEDGSDDPDDPLVRSYALLRELAPFVVHHQGRETMHGLLFDDEVRERIINDGGLRLTCRHNFTLPWDPRASDGSRWPECGGIVIRLAEDEYLVAGSGIVVEFATQDEVRQRAEHVRLGEDGFVQHGSLKQPRTGVEKPWQGGRCGLGSVDVVRVDSEGQLRSVRRLNGDQTHQGRHVRISVGEWQILHVKLYEYE